ncbi:MAG: DNA methyltransferase, partial [Verrucomicrobiia bacterium]
LAAIDAKDVPATPKKKIPLLTRDTPNLEFWVGKPVGFGRPGFKKHWKDLRSHLSPLSSWISRMNEDSDEEEFVTLRSREAGEGTGVLQAIFGQTTFNYPKPPSLMRQLVEQATGLDSIVMDFFGGSGTTAQAVLDQNLEDGGSRRFIVVSSTEKTEEEPSKNICRDVCAPRLKAVIEGYGGNAATGGDFAYLRTHRVERGRLTKLSHDQVWTMLQLIHAETLAPFEAKRWQWAGDAERALLYIPSFKPSDATALRKQLAGSAAVTLYSWQSELVRQHLPSEHVQFEQLPEALGRRFGLKG